MSATANPDAARDRKLILRLRTKNKDKPLGSFNGSTEHECTTDKESGRLIFDYVPKKRFFTGEEQPGDLLEEIDFFIKPRTKGEQEVKVVPGDKLNDKEGPSHKFTVAPVFRIKVQKSPFVRVASEAGDGGEAAHPYEIADADLPLIRKLFETGGNLELAPKLRARLGGR